jgi:Cu/Ag efflux protein CusF
LKSFSDVKDLNAKGAKDFAKERRRRDFLFDFEYTLSHCNVPMLVPGHQPKGESMRAFCRTRLVRDNQAYFVMILTATLSVGCQQPLRVNDAPSTPTPATGTPLVMPSPVFGKPYFGTGVITIINRKEGWVEIKHEEIKGLMPAMTMEFLVKTGSLLNQAQVGDRVDFTVVETGKGEFITELKKIVQ